MTLLDSDMGEQSAFALFRIERALRLHFGTEYDYFKYMGKGTGARVADFERRRDRGLYEALSRKDNPGERLLAVISDDPSKNIADVVNGPGLKQYDEWRKRRESLTYRFKTELRKLDLPEDLKVKGGMYPNALRMLIKGEISKETLIILERTYSFLDHWLQKIEDPILWPDYYMLVKKYSQFVRVDFDKYDALVQNVKNA